MTDTISMKCNVFYSLYNILFHVLCICKENMTKTMFTQKYEGNNTRYCVIRKKEKKSFTYVFSKCKNIKKYDKTEHGDAKRNRKIFKDIYRSENFFLVILTKQSYRIKRLNHILYKARDWETSDASNIKM